MYSYDSSLDSISNRVLRMEFDINELNLDLIYLKNIQSVLTLMKEKNWIEHDCSDYVKKSLTYHRHFIGTVDEYNTFLKTNKFN